MKWKKFQELVKRHPFVASEVSLLGVRLDNKEFIKLVSFIAFRPFTSLDLEARSTFKVESIVPEDALFAISRYEMVEYSVCVVVDGKNEHIVLPTPQSPTINNIIDIIDEAFEKLSMTGRVTSWLHIVKKSIHGSNLHLLTEMTIEIYKFPRLFRAKPQPPARFEKPTEAHVAYVTDAPMPPIIPS